MTSEEDQVPPESPIARSARTLREMDEETDQLEHTVDEARDAVRAAHDADSMASPDAATNERTPT